MYTIKELFSMKSLSIIPKDEMIKSMLHYPFDERGEVLCAKVDRPTTLPDMRLIIVYKDFSVYILKYGYGEYVKKYTQLGIISKLNGWYSYSRTLELCKKKPEHWQVMAMVINDAEEYTGQLIGNLTYDML